MEPQDKALFMKNAYQTAGSHCRNSYSATPWFWQMLVITVFFCLRLASEGLAYYTASVTADIVDLSCGAGCDILTESDNNLLQDRFWFGYACGIRQYHLADSAAGNNLHDHKMGSSRPPSTRTSSQQILTRPPSRSKSAPISRTIETAEGSI
jgi:hypothetical protein